MRPSYCCRFLALLAHRHVSAYTPALCACYFAFFIFFTIFISIFFNTLNFPYYVLHHHKVYIRPANNIIMMRHVKNMLVILLLMSPCNHEQWTKPQSSSVAASQSRKPNLMTVFSAGARNPGKYRGHWSSSERSNTENVIPMDDVGRRIALRDGLWSQTPG